MQTRISAFLVVSLLFACQGNTDDAPAKPGAKAEAPADKPAEAGEQAKPAEPAEAGAEGAKPEDLVMKAEDFDCITTWDKVGRVRVANRLGHLEEALKIAGSEDGGDYPVGTILQLIPTEAMVKRASGFSPETRDWEMFALEVSDAGTVIAQRGTTEVDNKLGTCAGCHEKGKEKWDFGCSTRKGCPPLPLTERAINREQDGDPRCK